MPVLETCPVERPKMAAALTDVSVVVNTLKLRPGRGRQAFFGLGPAMKTRTDLCGDFYMDTPKISHSHEADRYCHILHMNTFP